MSELAELLELLHSADAPFETLYGRFRTWVHHERANRAFRGYAKRQRGHTSAVTAMASREVPDESERIVSIWRQEPDRVRTEDSCSYAIAVGECWWRWSESAGAMSNEGDESVSSGVGEELAALLNPAQLLGVLRFEPGGRAERVGRQVIVADAWPRRLSRHWPDGFVLHELGLGANRYRLEIDAECGLVLASQALTDGEPFSEISALELTLDEPLDPALFVFVPPEGEEVRNALDMRHRHRDVSISEAQAAAPFTVVIPERVPSDWQVRGFYTGEAESAAVHLHYHSNSAHESVNFTQGNEAQIGLHLDDSFEEKLAGERTVWVRGRSERLPQAQLITKQDDTLILMTSDNLTAEQLMGLAAMLVPAPDKPSDL